MLIYIKNRFSAPVLKLFAIFVREYLMVFIIKQIENQLLSPQIMKKRLTVLAAVAACVFGFASCEDLNIDKLIEADVVGHINLYASNPTNTDKGDQFYANGDSTIFRSALCNVNITLEDGNEIDAGAVLVGCEKNLLTANNEADITFPLIGVNLRDTVPGTYQINCPVDQISFFEHLDTANWMSLITTNNISLGNIMVVATNENAMYIGYSGSIVIDQFSTMGTLVKGHINNVEAIYVTTDQLEALWEMDEAERANVNLINNFPHITFNGEISSRRANVTDILEALDEMEQK